MLSGINHFKSNLGQSSLFEVLEVVQILLFLYVCFFTFSKLSLPNFLPFLFLISFLHSFVHISNVFPGKICSNPNQLRSIGM